MIFLGSKPILSPEEITVAPAVAQLKQLVFHMHFRYTSLFCPVILWLTHLLLSVPHLILVLSLSVYPLHVSVTSSPFLISKPCIFSTPIVTQLSVSSSPPTCSLLLSFFFYINLELHEIIYHQKLRQLLSFKAGTLSICSSEKCQTSPQFDVTVRVENYSYHPFLLACLSLFILS